MLHNRWPHCRYHCPESEAHHAHVHCISGLTTAIRVSQVAGAAQQVAAPQVPPSPEQEQKSNVLFHSIRGQTAASKVHRQLVPHGRWQHRSYHCAQSKTHKFPCSLHLWTDRCNRRRHRRPVLHSRWQHHSATVPRARYSNVPFHSLREQTAAIQGT